MNSAVGSSTFLLTFLLLGSSINVLFGQSGPEVTRTALGETPIPPTKVTLYYNAQWELITPEKSVFRRETFLDLSEMIFSGIYKDYPKQNRLIADGFYHQGVRRGLQSEYFENGKLKSTIEYSDEGFIIWELVSETGKIEITKGTGEFTLPYYNFERLGLNVKSSEGSLTGGFTNGTRTGVWIFSDANGAKEEEYYVNGKRTIYYNNPGELRHIMEMYAEKILRKHEEYPSWKKLQTFSDMLSSLRRHGEAVERYDQYIDELPYAGGIEVDTGKPVELSSRALVVEQFDFDQTEFTRLNQFFEQYGPRYPKSAQRSVTFPGGLKNLLLLLESSKDLPEQNSGYDAAMLAKLKVASNGQLKSIRGVPFILYALEEFEKAIKPFDSKLLPALRNGKPYSSSIVIPISDAPGWINFLNTSPSEEVNEFLQALKKHY